MIKPNNEPSLTKLYRDPADMSIKNSLKKIIKLAIIVWTVSLVRIQNQTFIRRNQRKINIGVFGIWGSFRGHFGDPTMNLENWYDSFLKSAGNETFDLNLFVHFDYKNLTKRFPLMKFIRYNRSAYAHLGVPVYRFVATYNHIRSLKTRYEFILMTDVQDVTFGLGVYSFFRQTGRDVWIQTQDTEHLTYQITMREMYMDCFLSQNQDPAFLYDKYFPHVNSGVFGGRMEPFLFLLKIIFEKIQNITEKDKKLAKKEMWCDMHLVAEVLYEMRHRMNIGFDYLEPKFTSPWFGFYNSTLCKGNYVICHK